MKLSLIPEEGKFYKVNMHCHTTQSDGTQTPAEVKEWFKSHGYSAVVFTEHEVLLGHQDLTDEDFIALHGYELAFKKDIAAHTAFLMPVYHFNAISKYKDNLMMPRYYKNNPSMAGNAKEWMEKCGQYDENDIIDGYKYDIKWLNEYFGELKKHGFFINYNHPQWSLQNATDYLGLDCLDSVELINGGCLGQNDNTAIHYETILRSGVRIRPTAGDDNHSAGGCGRCWTMIKAPELSYEALMEGYEKGNLYASEGPEIYSIDIEEGKVKVKCSEAREISLHSQGRYAPYKRSKTELYTCAEFAYSPEKMGSFFRIEVRDKDGFKAFSNAYYIDEIEKMMKN